PELTPEARRFAPRTVDIDILLHDDQAISAPDDLHIPHLPAAHRALPPRPVHLDILFYDDQVISAPDDLHIPHLLAAERAFVLRPLADIAPGLHHPTLYRPVRELLDELVQRPLPQELLDHHDVRRGAYPQRWLEG